MAALRWTQLCRTRLLRNLLQQHLQQQQHRCMGSHGENPLGYLPIKCDIGTREVVGHGMNGEEMYIDNPHFPYPAIRFKEDDAEISALREKEKADWKLLTKEQQKTLYRASFCQTFAEVEAPTGEWKKIIGGVFINISIALWIMMWMSFYVCPPYPESFKEEHRRSQVEELIKRRVNPIEGFTSDYDYEKGEWKAHVRK